ncbi:hypothetical protein [Leptospira alstonii]|uniref:Uncharacterized protein n=2 Tax=Leptospira alstonii TaxID=28452 RepID=M6CFP7_9LEPT|nr:hypothetical protein [Leptospira alstonii]EMJ90564.1 hypothetical protein LEP1GSC194_3868 [Leptospira alstonii serovar Sichuan str. 79601]EQA82010.1 hypothetical protein LEP1GSC193_3459 [Leptospira alstonii serovar Pingchang str. 80-412]
MIRKYFSSRNQNNRLTLNDLYFKFQNLYLYFRDKDYFKQSGITKKFLSEAIKFEAAIKLSFQSFPITKWEKEDITEDRIFDTIEFLFDKVSKPGSMEPFDTDAGFQIWDYGSYSQKEGQSEYIEIVNMFLIDYGDGFELNDRGEILSLGDSALKNILCADILPYDVEHVDNKVINAIHKWRTRNQSLNDRKETIRELADVFEWLRKTKKLEKVLDKKDDALIFDLANNFAIRHHNPSQKGNYDKNIWYSWMFHFYLASYHAIIRLLIKHEK